MYRCRQRQLEARPAKGKAGPEAWRSAASPKLHSLVGQQQHCSQPAHPIQHSHLQQPHSISSFISIPDPHPFHPLPPPPSSPPSPVAYLTPAHSTLSTCNPVKECARRIHEPPSPHLFLRCERFLPSNHHPRQRTRRQERALAAERVEQQHHHCRSPALCAPWPDPDLHPSSGISATAQRER